MKVAWGDASRLIVNQVLLFLLLKVEGYVMGPLASLNVAKLHG
jgi:hypothetical protein